MHWRKWLAPTALLLGAICVFLIAGGWGWLSESAESVWLERVGPLPREVPSGDREIAWIHVATTDSWEQFVTGAKLAEGRVQGLHVDNSRAFPESTTAVPELVLRSEGVPGRLLVRWYKLTSRSDIPGWVTALTRRDPPPLAIIGGDNSARAKELAEELARQAPGGPLLLLTTATANRDPSTPGSAFLVPSAEQRDLMDIYPRTFRFCFNNAQMAEAVIDFLSQEDDLRPGSHGFGLEWEDDPYSRDLYLQFQDVLTQRQPFGPMKIFRSSIPYSVGRYYRANPEEAEAVRAMLRKLPEQSNERSLLILPIGAAPARRVLRSLSAEVPTVGRELVVVTGDSISWDVVFRDREFAWNIQAIPVPLVLFRHQNPVAWESRPGLPRPPHSTDSVLLNEDIVSVLARAAFHPEDKSDPPGLARNADELRRRLKCSPEEFFDPETGDRRRGTGECVVCVRPQYDLTAEPRLRVLPEPALEVHQFDQSTGTWNLLYNWPEGE